MARPVKRSGPREDRTVDAHAAVAILELARQVEAHAADADSAEWQARLAPDVVIDATATLVEVGRIDEALDLVGCLSVYWQDLGRISEGIELCRSVFEHAGSMRSRSSGRAHLVLGELVFRSGDQVTAAQESVLAREVADETEDAWTGARAELNLARVAFRDADASRIFRHAQNVFERADDNDRLTAGGRHMMGWAHYTAGDVPAALDTFEENAEAYRSIGAPINEASERANVADLAMESGDLTRAARNLAAAFSIPSVRTSRYLLPSLVRSAAALCSMRGDHERAVRLFIGAEELYRRYGFEPDPGDEFTPALHAGSIAMADDALAAVITRESTSLSDDELFEIADASILI